MPTLVLPSVTDSVSGLFPRTPSRSIYQTSWIFRTSPGPPRKRELTDMTLLQRMASMINAASASVLLNRPVLMTNSCVNAARLRKNLFLYSRPSLKTS